MKRTHSKEKFSISGKTLPHLDFTEGKSLSQLEREWTRSQLLCRAVGKVETVLDVTAGFGLDAFHLAIAGFRVRAWERSETLFLILQKAWRELNPEIREAIEGRLQFEYRDSLQGLNELSKSERPDTIYLDPMYPEKKKSALPRKEMIWLRKQVGDDPDSGNLLQLALQKARQRVVVKRPLKAPPLAPGVNHSFRGTTTRYDLYLIRLEV